MSKLGNAGIPTEFAEGSNSEGENSGGGGNSPGALKSLSKSLEGGNPVGVAKEGRSSDIPGPASSGAEVGTLGGVFALLPGRGGGGF